MASMMQAQMMQMAALTQMQMQMQMGAMAQMQMWRMQMLPGMVMPAPSPSASNHRTDDAQYAGCSLDDLAELETEVVELEQRVKASAKLKGAFVGLVARYNEDEGFGFITCPECKETLGRTSIFVSGRTLLTFGIDVGDVVSFTVEEDGKKRPRAINLKLYAELTKLKKTHTGMHNYLKPPRVQTFGPPGVTSVAAIPSLKRRSADLPSVSETNAKRPHLGADLKWRIPT